MSKRRKTTGIRDNYYQEFHFKRTLSVADTDQEWSIICPRPLQAPPAGRYYAIELHAIEYFIYRTAHEGQIALTEVCLTYSPRLGKTPFLTHAGDPENLFWHKTADDLQTGGGPISWEQGTGICRAVYTDHKGYGKLITGQNIWVQCHSLFYDNPVTFGFSCAYTYTTVPCSEYVQELVAQLTSS